MRRWDAAEKTKDVLGKDDSYNLNYNIAIGDGWVVSRDISTIGLVFTGLDATRDNQRLKKHRNS